VLGVFLFSEEGELLAFEPFDEGEAAEKLTSGELTPEERKLREKFPGARFEPVDGFPSPGGEFLRSNLEALLERVGVSREEYRRRLRRVALQVARAALRRSLERRDLLIKQAVLALEELEEALNVLSSRLREWYLIHFPEVELEGEKLAELVHRHGRREALPGLEELARRSSGAELTDEDIAMLRSFAGELCRLYELREELQRYLEHLMQSLAPNVTHLVGTTVGAKLIALAGGVERLASMPGSRIQVLGAEKALFRHLRGRGRPPKHGVIFQYPAIKAAPKWQRGKIARALAAKLAIAARLDAFGGEFTGEELRRRFEARVEEIRRMRPRRGKRRRRRR
ncbi:MAG: C/D box methylation guide ribonucleoprotein complex aNOP56 subunit, partial [Euryarchaeota archaeon]|nr:C/D box methylation guide ribonucleoprotein complex aNOP56 subunit [Euryarchaeota archaeon]